MVYLKRADQEVWGYAALALRLTGSAWQNGKRLSQPVTASPPAGQLSFLSDSLRSSSAAFQVR
jgi:hypothetical protein